MEGSAKLRSASQMAGPGLLAWHRKKQGLQGVHKASASFGGLGGVAGSMLPDPSISLERET